MFLCQQNLDLLNADEESDVWKAYVDYVDEIVVDGFFNTIMCSLKFMLENTDAKSTTEPLYEAVLELQVCCTCCYGWLFPPCPQRAPSAFQF